MQKLAVKKLWTGAVTMALLLLPAMAALADGSRVEGGFDGHHGMHGWSGFVFGPIMMILIVVAVVALVVMLLRWLGIGPRDTTRRGALDILEERFARGEIDKEEFDERRRALSD